MPTNVKKKIYLIVGEESGENIAVSIVDVLKKFSNFQLYGIGGKKLEKRGLKSLFPFSELSIMGLVEVIPKLPKIIYLINKTIKNIVDIKPDLIVTIDAPDFSFRILKKVKKIIPNTKTLHIVAPTVWAWKAYRAKNIANYVDNLFVLFPFEKKYFNPYGIKTTFIGHPLIEKIKLDLKKTTDTLRYKKKIISIFPGSRKAEIKKHLYSILLYLSKNEISKEYKFIIVAVDRYIKLIKTYEKEFSKLLDITTLSSSKYKNYSLKFSDCAIAVSGTISLELAVSKIPVMVVYKLNLFSFFILKRLVKVKYISLANIVLNKRIIPELVQSDFCYKKFNYEFNNLIRNKNKIFQIENFKKLIIKLNTNIPKGNKIAVMKILDLL